MNRTKFWTGLSMIAVQVLAIVGFLLIQLDWSWLTLNLIAVVVGGLVFVIFNITAIVFMIAGSKENSK